MIDLHSHTDESDGSFTPVDLVCLAHKIGLQALAITDHDTFAGFALAQPVAAQAGLPLVCGIELSTKYLGQSVHLLGYFFDRAPRPEFLAWVEQLKVERLVRNQQLVEKMQAMGFQITLEEIQARGWKRPGRPHFAQLMLEKGYTSSIQQAFDQYLDQSGSCYVSRNEPTFEQAVARIAAAGGIASLPHPGRVSQNPETLEAAVRAMRAMGLSALEAFHSDHTPEDVATYERLAKKFGLLVTGGSDFHGTFKPDIALGTGRNHNLCLPSSLLDQLRALALSSS